MNQTIGLINESESLKWSQVILYYTKEGVKITALEGILPS